MNKKRQRKRCKLGSCKKLFDPVRDFQKCCSFEHDMEFINDKNNLKNLIDEGKKRGIKVANKRKKEFRQSDKSLLKELAQKIVNTYIRLRDQENPCCSCGHTEGRQFHAGHYESAGGNQQQRFYTLNIHKQCSICNNYKSGNLIPYRLFMIEKYGLEKVEAIESDHSIKKYDVEYLQKLIKVFRKKIKLYKKRR